MTTKPQCPDGQPRLAYWINRQRVVNSANAEIRDATGKPLNVDYRWLVATIRCPYCGALHEHPISSYSRWGTYTAPCDTRQAYCLVREVPESELY